MNEYGKRKVESGVNNNVNTNTTVISGGINAQQTGNAETVQESNGQSFDAINSFLPYPNCELAN